MNSYLPGGMSPGLPVAAGAATVFGKASVRPRDRARSPAWSSCKFRTVRHTDCRTRRRDCTKRTCHRCRRNCTIPSLRRVRLPPRFAAAGSDHTRSRASIGSPWCRSTTFPRSSTPVISSWLASFQSACRRRHVGFRPRGRNRCAGARVAGSGGLTGSAVGDRGRRTLLARRSAPHTVPAVASRQATPHHPENHQD